MRRNHGLNALVALMAVSSLLSCKDEILVVVEVDRVVVGGPDRLLALDSYTFTATPYGDQGRKLLGRICTWSTSDGSKANVDQHGNVLGVLGGGVSIIASCENVRGEKILDVENPIPGVLSIEPSALSMGDGPVQVTVRGQKFVSLSKVYWNDDPLQTQPMGEGQLTATVVACRSRISFVRSRYIFVPMLSSIHIRPPPAPQQKLSLPLRSISLISSIETACSTDLGWR